MTRKHDRNENCVAFFGNLGRRRSRNAGTFDAKGVEQRDQGEDHTGGLIPVVEMSYLVRNRPSPSTPIFSDRLNTLWLALLTSPKVWPWREDSSSASLKKLIQVQDNTTGR